MGRRTTDVQDAVDQAMSEIDDQEYSGIDVSPGETREFLEGIIEGCRTRIGALQREDDEGEGEDDRELEVGEGDDDDG